MMVFVYDFDSFALESSREHNQAEMLRFGSDSVEYDSTVSCCCCCARQSQGKQKGSSPLFFSTVTIE